MTPGSTSRAFALVAWEWENHPLLLPRHLVKRTGELAERSRREKETHERIMLHIGGAGAAVITPALKRINTAGDCELEKTPWTMKYRLTHMLSMGADGY